MNQPSGTEEITGLQNALVEKLKRTGCIKSPNIEEAFRSVPRHLFTPGIVLEKVYSDISITTKRKDGKFVSSSSQPAMMAIMLEQLQLQPGHRVLEIGAGTGFNAGLMARIVGDSGLVVTVDLDEDLVEGAREHLRSAYLLGTAGLGGVKVICGDGGLGYAEYAPYDRIILTVGAWDIVPAWRDQLKPGGRLVLPLEIKGNVQKCIAFDNVDGHLKSVSVTSCGFITLRGAFARSQDPIFLGPEPGLSISVNDGVRVNRETVFELLSGPGEDQPSGVRAHPGEIFGSLALWLSLREPGLCFLQAEGQFADRGIMPRCLAVQNLQKVCMTLGLLGDEALCALVLPPGASPSPEPTAGPQPSEIFVHSFGREAELAGRLIEQIRAWDAAGRPSDNRLRIRAYPVEFDYTPSADEFVVQKRWTRLVLDWK
jgi:protein-L-isoaspartate(D-aspartate) O-methyltransferase